jgi:hypothetical protein
LNIARGLLDAGEIVDSELSERGRVDGAVAQDAPALPRPRLLRLGSCRAGAFTYLGGALSSAEVIFLRRRHLTKEAKHRETKVRNQGWHNTSF